MASATQITTGKVRFSFLNVFKPRAAQEGAAEKYSATLLIPKTDKATLAKIAAAKKAAVDAYKASGKKLPPNLKETIHDGDGVRPGGEEFGPECAGHYVMTVSANVDRQPVIVDANKLPITDPREFKSGDYGKAIINFFAYNTAGNAGVSAGLNGVMKLHDGEALVGGHVSDEDWDMDDDDDDMLD